MTTEWQLKSGINNKKQGLHPAFTKGEQDFDNKKPVTNIIT